MKILKIFNEHCPIVGKSLILEHVKSTLMLLSPAEKASIDESFLDLTLPVRAKLLARYPYLATLPEGANLDTPLPTPKEMGVTVDWDKVGNLIPINGQEKEVVKEISVGAEQEGEGEGKEEGTSKSAEHVEEKVVEKLEEPDLTWSDVALAIGAEIVATCRGAVHQQLGYTCSAGIAPNKVCSCSSLVSESVIADLTPSPDVGQTLLGLDEAQRSGRSPSLLPSPQLYLLLSYHRPSSVTPAPPPSSRPCYFKRSETSAASSACKSRRLTEPIRSAN